jgi:hypothetical protein
LKGLGEMKIFDITIQGGTLSENSQTFDALKALLLENLSSPEKGFPVEIVPVDGVVRSYPSQAYNKAKLLRDANSQNGFPFALGSGQGTATPTVELVTGASGTISISGQNFPSGWNTLRLIRLSDGASFERSITSQTDTEITFQSLTVNLGDCLAFVFESGATWGLPNNSKALWFPVNVSDIPEA